jgi:SulP family sulfate permease
LGFDLGGVIQNYKVLILDITDVPRIGISASLAIERMVQEAQTAGRIILIAGANSKLQQRLRQFGVHGELVASRREALHIATQAVFM